MRKQLGLSFLGETREGEHWVIADMILEGIDPEVSEKITVLNIGQ